jgi:hypothetical protein
VDLVTQYNPVRFWAKVEKTETCWLWTGHTSKSGGRYGKGGYGQYRSRMAHRLAWELIRGPIPEGLVLDHLCEVTRCVNPDHLEPVTTQENTRRHYDPRRKSTCPQGHEFTAENTYVSPGRNCRFCRACNRVATARYLARKKASA